MHAFYLRTTNHAIAPFVTDLNLKNEILIGIYIKKTYLTDSHLIADEIKIKMIVLVYK